MKNHRKNGLAILVSGLGIGWLLGLAQTPVLNTVLTSVIAVAAGLITVLMGLSTGDNKAQPNAATQKRISVPPVNAVPLMLLVLGLAVGASGGLYTRVQRILTRPAPLSDTATARPRQVPQVATSSEAAPGLFAAPEPRQCERLRGTSHSVTLLTQAMIESAHPLLSAVARGGADSTTLVHTVQIVCANEAA
ncbi:MAG: hypothetical protein AB1941_02870 [Gemmatimonadota bacterium]